MNEQLLWVPLMAGGIAGIAVDVSLFPLDTIKTRLQSSRGFFPSGGFNGIYRGILSAALGSFPTSATFFCGYEISKKKLEGVLTGPSSICMISAGFGEVVGCLIRVPTEVVKQRAQANRNLSSQRSFLFTIESEGISGLYRGYFKTVLREVPFSFIQFPVWELLKKKMSGNDEHLSAFKSAMAGAISGAIAGALTTPLDVVKTRVMLAEKETSTAHAGAFEILYSIGKNGGISKLYSGMIPRSLWLCLGGFVFLGAYDTCKLLLIELDSGKKYE